MPSDAAARHRGRHDRVCLRRRPVDGAERRRHRCASDGPRRARALPQALARRPHRGVHGRIRWQYRRLQGAGRWRRAAAAHLAPGSGPGRRLDPRRQVDPGPVAARLGDPALRPLLPGARGRRIRAHAAAADRRLRLVRARRQPARVRLAELRQPHLETLPRRQRARDLDLRLQDQPLREDHRVGGRRRVADVGRPHDLLLLGPGRTARQPVGLGRGPEDAAAGHALRGLRREVAQRGHQQHRVRERWLPLRHEPARREGDQDPRAGAGRQAGGARRVPQRREVDQQLGAVALRQAGGVRSPWRPVHGAGREGRRAQPHPDAGGARA